MHGSLVREPSCDCALANLYLNSETAVCFARVFGKHDRVTHFRRATLMPEQAARCENSKLTNSIWSTPLKKRSHDR